MKKYLFDIWKARYFWIHLTLSDLRSRWRRSYLGILWSLIQPLGMTILIAVVFGRLFKLDILEYAPYILSGFIVWDFVTTVLTNGSLAFVQSDAYIKQYKQPLAIYTLRIILSNMLTMLLASVSLYIWVAIAMPENITFHWLSTFAIYPILLAIAWPLTTIFAYYGVRFRDIPHLMVLVLQAIWFVSPIYFDEKMFRSSGLDKLIDFNPIYHILEIFRAPLLNGTFPTMTNYSICIGMAVIVTLLAIFIGIKQEKRVIYYL